MSGQVVLSQNQNKKRGRRPTGKGKPVMVRFQPIDLAKLDGWILTLEEPITRAQAIRVIVRESLEEYEETYGPLSSIGARG